VAFGGGGLIRGEEGHCIFQNTQKFHFYIIKKVIIVLSIYKENVSLIENDKISVIFSFIVFKDL
jgi:hypothetical protein